MIRWGILVAGKIANRFIKSLFHHEECKLVAIASLTKEKRERMRMLYSDVKIYDDYNELIQDKDIDVIYIALVHSLHFEWAKKVLCNYKAVLCEKPATLAYEENKILCDLARKNKVFFMEAMKTRLIPLIKDVTESIDKGIIGEIIQIETCFANNVNYNKDHYFFDKEQGGVLNNVASYNLAFIFDFIHSSIKEIKTKASYSDQIDIDDQIELKFESGQIAYVDISCNHDKPKLGVIYGTNGKIVLHQFYRPKTAEILLNDGTKFNIEKDYINDDFYTEIDEVIQCLKRKDIESARMSFEDSLKIRLTIDRIRETLK